MKVHFKNKEIVSTFTLHGKPASDSGLSPWALGSLGRSILFYAESMESKGNLPLEIVSAYYAMFHLGMFIMFAVPKLLTFKERKELNNRLKNGTKDPSPLFRHKDVENFLQLCSKNGLSHEAYELFKELKNAREFINYGPRVYWKEYNNIRIDTCEIHLDRIETTINNLKNIYIFTINWACQKGTDKGIWIPMILEQAAKFYFKTNGFYLEWIPNSVRKEAETLRAQLYEIAFRKIYKKSAP